MALAIAKAPTRAVVDPPGGRDRPDGGRIEMHRREERGPRPGRHALPLVLFALVACIAGRAQAEPDRAERWVPAFELGLDAQFDDRSASVTGNVSPGVSGKDTGSIAIVRSVSIQVAAAAGGTAKSNAMRAGENTRRWHWIMSKSPW